MAFYYPQDVSENMGGTGILPGTQYQSSLNRDDEFIGEIAQENQSQEFKIFGPAGTIAIVHYDIWHRATANTTDRHRYMMKCLFQRCAEPVSLVPSLRLSARSVVTVMSSAHILATICPSISQANHPTCFPQEASSFSLRD